MDTDNIVIELNNNCEYKKQSWAYYNFSAWEKDDIDIENNKIRKYCAHTYGSMGRGCHYLDGHLCKSCEKIINKYKNKYMIKTNDTNIVLEKILESLDQIKNDIRDTNKRLNKMEEDIKDKNITTDDNQESNNEYD